MTFNNTTNSIKIFTILFLFLLSIFLSSCGGGNEDYEDETLDANAGITVTPVVGNTASYNAVAHFDVVLKTQPKDDVVIPISSSDPTEGKPDENQIIFTSKNWNYPKKVIVKGRNRNVDNGKQNYKIILNSVQSRDPSYNGIDPDDVDIKGIFLSLFAPSQSLNFISGLDKQLTLKTVYTGNKVLSYSLLENPEGMTINFNKGYINWNPTESLEGKNYDVTARVSDGILSSSITFSVNVVTSTKIQTFVSKNEIKVTEAGNSLNGLMILSTNSDLSNQGVKILPIDTLPISNRFNRQSDVFIFSEKLRDKVTLEFPIPNTINENGYYRLYAYNYDDNLWSTVESDIRSVIKDNNQRYLQLSLYQIGETPMFFGLKKKIILDSNGQLKSYQGKSSSSQQADTVTCSYKQDSHVGDYHICTYQENNEIKIIGYFEDIWNGNFSPEDIAFWAIDAQPLFESFGLSFDKSFSIELEDLGIGDDGETPEECPLSFVYIAGFVSLIENYEVLHLNSSKCLSGSFEGTVVHEYFHQAQDRSRLGGNQVSVLNFLPQNNKLWLTEGTANWIMGEKDQDLLTNYMVPTFLEKGINAESIVSWEGEERKLNPYLKYPFWELISDKCNFKDSSRLVNIFNINIGSILNDLSGVKNFINHLVDFNCDFGIEMGNSNSDTIAEALLRYQYETLYNNNTEIGFGSRFNNSPYKFSQTDWVFVDQTDSVGTADIGSIEHIEPYGAVSIKIEPGFFNNIEESHEAVLSIKTDQPLVVSLLSENSQFSGNSLLDGIQHHYYNTSEQSEYIFNKDEKVDFFVTLVNPSSHRVSITKPGISFSIREKVISELQITAPSEGDNLNKRVISITGQVLGEAPDVDRVVISNGDIKTITTVAADNSFVADVVIVMGKNILIAQGYNSSDLTQPLTKAKIININGIEDTLSERNSLISSRFAVILRWNTNDTDIDLYSTDKNNATIWYSTPSAYPGSLDYDNTSGFGPEVISYRLLDSPIYNNGIFEIDVHFYDVYTSTNFTLDIIMNENTSNLRKMHYESIKSLLNGNYLENGPLGVGNSRFNDILSISCNPICDIKSFNRNILSDQIVTGTNSSVIDNVRFVSHGVLKKSNNNVEPAHKSSYEKCIQDRLSNLAKASNVNWVCDKQTGAKIWE